MEKITLLDLMNDRLDFIRKSKLRLRSDPIVFHELEEN